MNIKIKRNNVLNVKREILQEIHEIHKLITEQYQLGNKSLVQEYRNRVFKLLNKTKEIKR